MYDNSAIINVNAIPRSSIISEGEWYWFDGTRTPMPNEDWNMWYDGQPDNDQGAENCMVMTNYRYWSVNKLILESYVWRDYSCFTNPQEIQGYVCERKITAPVSYVNMILCCIAVFHA